MLDPAIITLFVVSLTLLKPHKADFYPWLPPWKKSSSNMQFCSYTPLPPNTTAHSACPMMSRLEPITPQFLSSGPLLFNLLSVLRPLCKCLSIACWIPHTMDRWLVVVISGCNIEYDIRSPMDFLVSWFNCFLGDFRSSMWSLLFILIRSSTVFPFLFCLISFHPQNEGNAHFCTSHHGMTGMQMPHFSLITRGLSLYLVIPVTHWSVYQLCTAWSGRK